MQMETLLLWNPVRASEEAGSRVCRDTVQQAEVEALRSLPNDDLTDFLNDMHGADVAPRAAAICACHLLAVHAAIFPPTPPGESDAARAAPHQQPAALAAGEYLADALLEFAASPGMSTTAYKKGDATHRLKVRTWQVRLCKLYNEKPMC